MYFSNAGKPGSALARRTAEVGAETMMAGGVLFFLLASIEGGEEVDANAFAALKGQAAGALAEASGFYRSLSEHAEEDAPPFTYAEAEQAAIPRWFAFNGIFLSEVRARQAPMLLAELSEHLRILSDMLAQLQFNETKERFAPEVFRLMFHWQEAMMYGRALAIFFRERPVFDEDAAWLRS